MPFYYLSNYRTEEQLADMLRLDAQGICLFCRPHLESDAEQRILHRTDSWSVTLNEFPYRGTRLHLLLVPDEHVGDLLDLSAAAQADFWAALGWVRSRYELTYYGLGARNGDGRFTGATIEHVHVHVVVGDVDSQTYEPVRLKFSSRPDPDKELRLRRRGGVDPDQLDPGGAQDRVAVEHGVWPSEKAPPEPGLGD
jgi:diadenosine tetraphosphate (Ap4A) HIT family hydrolase